MFEFVPYTEKQKENWSNSKRIVICENQEQFCSFIESSLTDGSFDKKLYFGMISHEHAEMILEVSGLSVEGFNCSISSFEIRKINNSHGDEEKESSRGQRAFTVSDYLILPFVILSADSVELSPKKYNDNPVLVFRKNIGEDSFCVIAVVSDKHMDVFIQTSWIGNKKRNLSAPTAE